MISDMEEDPLTKAMYKEMSTRHTEIVLEKKALQTDNELSRKLVDAHIKQIQTLEARIAELKTDIEGYVDANTELLARVAELEKTIAESIHIVKLRTSQWWKR